MLVCGGEEKHLQNFLVEKFIHLLICLINQFTSQTVYYKKKIKKYNRFFFFLNSILNILNNEKVKCHREDAEIRGGARGYGQLKLLSHS